MSSNPAPEHVDREWLTVDEYAATFRVTRRTVERWIARGDLQATKHGRTTRIHRREIEPEDTDPAGSGARLPANVLTIRR